MCGVQTHRRRTSRSALPDMAALFKTPLGNYIPFAGLNPRVAGTSVAWNDTVLETLRSVAAAQRYLKAMIARIVALSAAALYIEDLSAGLILDVAPAPFGPLTDTVQVFGAGLTSALLASPAKLRIEDTGGGQDNNGVTMTPTWVNSTLLTCVPLSIGDGDGGLFVSPPPGTAGAVIVYIQDSGGTAWPLAEVLAGNTNTNNQVTLT